MRRLALLPGFGLVHVFVLIHIYLASLSVPLFYGCCTGDSFSGGNKIGFCWKKRSKCDDSYLISVYLVGGVTDDLIISFLIVENQ